MAVVYMPPCGPIYEAERRRELKRIEDTTLDTVERYKLREARMYDDLTSATAALVRQASKNKVTAEMLRKHDD